MVVNYKLNVTLFVTFSVFITIVFKLLKWEVIFLCLVPASNLAEAKEHKLQRIKDFEAAAIDEEWHSRTASPPPKDKLENQPLTRERFED